MYDQKLLSSKVGYVWDLINHPTTHINWYHFRLGLIFVKWNQIILKLIYRFYKQTCFIYNNVNVNVVLRDACKKWKLTYKIPQVYNLNESIFILLD